MPLCRADAIVADEDLAFVRRQQADHVLERDALAHAGSADHDEHLAALDLEARVVEYGASAQHLGHVVEPYHQM